MKDTTTDSLCRSSVRRANNVKARLSVCQLSVVSARLSVCQLSVVSPLSGYAPAFQDFHFPQSICKNVRTIPTKSRERHFIFVCNNNRFSLELSLVLSVFVERNPDDRRDPTRTTSSIAVVVSSWRRREFEFEPPQNTVVPNTHARKGKKEKNDDTESTAFHHQPPTRKPSPYDY